jgi:hypothetical protein
MPFYSQECIIKESIMNIKMLKAAIAGLVLSVSGFVNAGLITFDTNSTPGITLGGGMEWNATGGGHLFDNYYNSTSSIFFDTDTYVTSFDLNNKPWEGYSTATNITDYQIFAFDVNNVQIWNTLVDLSSYGTWNNWLTLNVNIANVRELKFGPAGNSAWPSIDNLVINEPSTDVPEPSTLAIFALGIMGLAARRFKKQ